MPRNRPEWVKETPAESYDRGVEDAGLYIAFGKDVDLIIPEAHFIKKRNHAFFAGMVARAYGVHLRPAGRF